MSRQSIQKKVRQQREPARLTAKLDARLFTYAVAATAAGVGMMTATPAEAEVVAHPANISVPYNGGVVQFDINGDGQMDFGLSWGTDKGPRHKVRRQTCSTDCLPGFSSDMKVIPAQVANEIWQTGKKAGFAGEGSVYCAAALGPGRRVGPSAAFKGPGTRAMYWLYENPISGANTACPWNSESPRYLGVKFVDTKGNLHYGWVRVSISGGVTITGYAYETTPNKIITTGVTTGAADDARLMEPTDSLAPGSAPASLGMLALGAPGLVAWRRLEEEQRPVA
ncbi:MAG: hypothetical protein WAL56_20840 [Candidatus Sulfotelmatobacter sp.]